MESGYAPYPWRRYLPLADRARQERHPWLSRYIARRIERFLDVHPSYADERRTIRLAFVNPGRARHIRDALVELVTTYSKRRRGMALRELPSVELQLLSDGVGSEGVLGSDLDAFMGFEPEDGQPSEETLEVMKRLSYTKGATAEYLQDPKASLTSPSSRILPAPPRTDRMDGDAHPSSMYGGGLAADTERLASIEPAATRFLSATGLREQADGARADRCTHERGSRRSRRSAGEARHHPCGGRASPTRRYPSSTTAQTGWYTSTDTSAWSSSLRKRQGGVPYILDYTDQETPEPGIYDGITATSQIAPYPARIAEVLGTAVDPPVPERAAERLLRTLNLISGRWARTSAPRRTCCARGSRRRSSPRCSSKRKTSTVTPHP